MPLRPAFHAAYSGLHLYEEAVLGFPLPLRERDRVRGKAVATHLLIQTKSAVGVCEVLWCSSGMTPLTGRAGAPGGIRLSGSSTPKPFLLPLCRRQCYKK